MPSDGHIVCQSLRQRDERIISAFVFIFCLFVFGHLPAENCYHAQRSTSL
jgi:hypothetical protein